MLCQQEIEPDPSVQAPCRGVLPDFVQDMAPPGLPTRHSDAAEDSAAAADLDSEAAGAADLAGDSVADSGLPGLPPIPHMDITRHHRRPLPRMNSMHCKQRHNI